MFHRTGKFSFGVNGPPEAIENIEVSAMKRICPQHSRLPWIAGIERAEMPARPDLSGRLRILHSHLVGHSVFRADRTQAQLVNLKSQRRLFARARDFEHRPIGDELTNRRLRVRVSALKFSVLAQCRHLTPKPL